MVEIWKTINYAPNYEVSNLGNIKNKKTNKLITINYERLKKDNKRARPGLSGKAYYLHRIVAQHFIDNPDNLPEVNHIDGDFYNNKADNLEWISKLDNMGHASENKLMKRYTRKVIITNKETGEEKIFNSVTDCANYVDRSPGQVSLSCRNKRDDPIYEMKYEKEERCIIEDENIIWKEYPENNKYLVSNTGEVKNKMGRIMMGGKQNGYRTVNMRGMNRLIHRMVAQTYLPNPDNKSFVNHKDTNILNNHLENLEWVTPKENMNTEETIKNLKKGKNSKTILQIEIETGNIINKFYGASEGQNKLDIDCSNILRICHFYHKGYSVVTRTTQKTYKKKYIFIFDEDKDKLNKFLIIAKKRADQTPNQLSRRKQVYQINKETNETINTFESSNEASRKLNISACIINGICNHYKYNDEDRPKCYKYLHSHKGFIYKQIL